MKNLCDLHTGHEQTLGDLWVKKETLDGWPWLLTKMCTGTPPLREPIWIGDHRSIYIHPGFTNSSSGILSKLIIIKVQGYSGWLMANKIQFPLSCTTARRWFQTSRFVWPLWWCRGRSCLTGLLVGEKHVVSPPNMFANGIPNMSCRGTMIVEHPTPPNPNFPVLTLWGYFNPQGDAKSPRASPRTWVFHTCAGWARLLIASSVWHSMGYIVIWYIWLYPSWSSWQG